MEAEWRNQTFYDCIQRNGFIPLKAPKFHRDISGHLIKKLDLVQLLGENKKDNASVGCLFCLKIVDEDLVATSCGDLIELYNVHTGELVESLRDHTEIITSLQWFHRDPHSTAGSRGKEEDIGDDGDTFVPNGSFFSGSLDKTIKLWKNYKVTATFKEHCDWIRCLSLSQDNRQLLSGCVSSSIYGWDIEAGGKVLFRITNAHMSQACPDLNTINGLQFCNKSSSMFMSGARDGTINLYDTRTLPQPVHVFQAHNAKLNSISFSKDDLRILSGGRDSHLRLWDVRKLQDAVSPNLTQSKNALISEYNKHRCSGYNVVCSFYNDENNIITGSEDKKVYIYDTRTGNVEKTLDDHPSVVHLVHSSDQMPLTIVSSTIENCAAFVWSPTTTTTESVQEKNTQLSALVPTDEQDAFLHTHRAAVETLMRKHGDSILKLFHKYNFTFNGSVSQIDWNSLRQAERTEGMESLMQMVREMAEDFAREMQLTDEETENPEEET
eukprot:TRINITY_DN7431_c0_g1_i1.p1 TRINITY_DN7431_c0_g1~~TRINITY_DN7431_c0_g1_i1.p1  ORF type:complete len:495 (-),score=65.33 TRINITY_DN7431_c0_g1_i1:40-1524(-)